MKERKDTIEKTLLVILGVFSIFTVIYYEFFKY